jgi:hypothetical protein
MKNKPTNPVFGIIGAGGIGRIHMDAIFAGKVHSLGQLGAQQIKTVLLPPGKLAR